MTQRIYYGWYVVFAAFVVMLVGFASAYSFSAFFPSLQAEFQATRAEVSLVFSIGGSLYFFLGALSGPLADRYGPRWICVFGLLVLGAGLTVAAHAGALAMVYLGFGLGIGIGVGFSYVPAVGAVQPWFTTRRGFASGLAVSGIGVGTMAGPLLASYLIDAYGWRTALMSMGIGTLMLGVCAALVLENRPDARAGPSGISQANPPASEFSLTLSQAMRTRPFVLLFLSAACLSFALFVPFVHLVPYALDQGLTAANGALVIGLVGVGSTVGRFAVGSVADRYGRLFVYVCAFVGVVLMFFVWLLSFGLWTLAFFALGFGGFYGGFVALAPALTVDFFGTRAAAGIIGVLYSSVGIGTLIGPWFAGFVFDQMGTYGYAIVAGELAACIAAGLAMLLPEPRQWRRYYQHGA